jgi:membrane protein
VLKAARHAPDVLAVGVLAALAIGHAMNLTPDRRSKAAGAPPPRTRDDDHSPSSYEAREPGRGRAARSPAQIPARGWIDIAWRVFQGYNGDRLGFVAGGVTYFTLLSIFPALSAFVSLYGLFFDVNEVWTHLRLLAGMLPFGVLEFLGEQMQRIASKSTSGLGLTFVTSLLISIWSANGSVKSLIYGLNVAYHETEKRNFFRYALLTLTFTIGGVVAVLLVTAVVVVTPVVLSYFPYLPAAELALLRWPALFLFYVAVLTLLYRYGPCRSRARLRWLTPGGFFAAVLNLGGSGLFSWYLSNVANYDATYGSLGTIMGFMFWIWVSTVVVLLGAELNAEMEHQTARDTTTGQEKPLGDRGALVADTVGPRRGKPGAAKFTMAGAEELSRRILLRNARKPHAETKEEDAKVEALSQPSKEPDPVTKAVVEGQPEKRPKKRRR